MTDLIDAARPMSPIGSEPTHGQMDPAEKAEDRARGQFITQMLDRIRDTREKTHKYAYDMMRKSAQRAYAGCDAAWEQADKYVANQLQRYVNQRVATLYAKNPRIEAKRRRQMDYALWDGTPESLMQARQTVDMHAQMLMAGDIMGAANPQILQQVDDARAILEEVQEAAQRRLMLDRLGRTMECLLEWAWNEQQPEFKKIAKGAVRRSIVYSVGWIQLGYQRAMEPAPDRQKRIDDITDQVAAAEALAARIEADKLPEDAPDIERLRLTLQSIQQEPEILAYEGLTFDEVDPSTVTVDPACTDLSSLSGAGWVARHWLLTPQEVQECWGVDLKTSQFTPYEPQGSKQEWFATRPSATDTDPRVMVFRVWHAATRTTFVIADGYRDYIVPPEAPDTPIDNFFPLFAFVPNVTPGWLYPKSDIELLWHMQKNHNAQREDLAAHRRRNRPGWVGRMGALETEDIEALKSNEINGYVELKGLNPNEPVNAVIQAKPTAPIDPNLYDTSQVLDDWQRVAGSADAAAMGAVQGATATESAIAEGSRDTSRTSQVDDIDGWLSAIALAAGQTALAQFDEATVREIVGPGAVWPTMDRRQIASMVRLKIAAGSSGRPNTAALSAKLRDMGPLLMQVPGFAPFIQRKMVEVFDEDTDPDEIIAAGMPSIVAMNTMMTGKGSAPDDDMAEDPEDDPEAQGDEGGSEAPSPDEAGGEARPAFPSGPPGM